MFGGPVSVATSGYLYAVGDSVSVLVAIALHTMVWWAVALLLVRTIGVPAVGIGWCASSLVESIILSRQTNKHTSIKVFRQLWLPSAVGVAAALTGAIYGVGMIVLRRDLVFDVVGLMRRSTASLTG
jgi:hypothetical protein